MRDGLLFGQDCLLPCPRCTTSPRYRGTSNGGLNKCQMINEAQTIIPLTRVFPPSANDPAVAAMVEGAVAANHRTSVKRGNIEMIRKGRAKGFKKLAAANCRH